MDTKLMYYLNILWLPRLPSLSLVGGRKWYQKLITATSTLAGKRDKILTLSFYRNLNCLISHSNQEIMFNASKTKLLHLYSWTKQKASHQALTSQLVSVTKCHHYKIYRNVIFRKWKRNDYFDCCIIYQEELFTCN